MEDTTPAAQPAKTTKASRKKQSPAHETHGALTSKEPMNMMKAFGIKDGYSVNTLEEYDAQIRDMAHTELHDHAHSVGVVPVEPQHKLIDSLLGKFKQTKASRRPPRTFKLPTRSDTDPEMKKFMKNWWNGDLGG